LDGCWSDEANFECLAVISYTAFQKFYSTSEGNLSDDR
jgi:hypothetical protein